MARGTAGVERDAAASRPVMREEAAGLHVLADIDGSGWKVLNRRSRQRRQYAIFDVQNIDGASPQRFFFCTLQFTDVSVECCDPREYDILVGIDTRACHSAAIVGSRSTSS